MSRNAISLGLVGLLAFLLFAAQAFAQTNYFSVDQEKPQPKKTEAKSAVVKEAAQTAKPAPAAKAHGTVYQEWIKAVVLVENFNNLIGTGFFINQNGLIITSSAVVRDSWEVTITTKDNRKYKGKIIAKDKKAGLALVSSPQGTSHWLELIPQDKTPVGEELVVVGAHLGFDWSLTKGVVSANRNIEGVTMLQTDADTNPGCEGGPWILKDSGKVVGVHRGQHPAPDTEGLNYAVSGASLRAFLEQYNK